MVGGDHAVELAGAADRAGSSRRRWPPAARWWSSPPSRRRPRRWSSPRLVEEAGFPPGVVQRRHRVRGRRRARRSSRIRASTRWRSRASTATGTRGDARRRRAPRARDAGAGRQVAEHRLRRRRPRGGGQRRRRGHLRRHRADLHGGLAAAGAGRGPRRAARRLAARARRSGSGDPLEPETEMGPVAFAGHLDNVQRRIAAARGRGRPAGHRRRRGPRAARASSSSRRSSATSPTTWRSRARRSSARCSPRCAFSDEDEAVAPGQRHRLRAGRRRLDARRAARAPDGARASAPGPSGSTPTAPSGRWRPSAASRRAAWGARTGSRRSHEYTELKTVWVELGGATRDPFKLG